MAASFQSNYRFLPSTRRALPSSLLICETSPNGGATSTLSLTLDKSRPQERFGLIEILTGNSAEAYRRFSLDNLVCSRP